MADISVGTMTLAQMVARIIEKQDTFEGGQWILSMIDALTAQRDKATAEAERLAGELAEARAFISTIIDAPKDYPAEVSE